MSKSKAKKAETEPTKTRATDEWEANVKITSRGKTNATPERKIATKGVHAINADYIIRSIREYARKGFEVRLVDDEGEDAVRFFPCLNREMTEMQLVAATMGDCRHSYEGIGFRATKRGKTIDWETLRKERADRLGKFSRVCVPTETLHVTPDTMVKCPKCGTTFRVGKQLV